MPVLPPRYAEYFSIVVLGLGAAAFAAFGVQWLGDPVAMATPLGIHLANGDATSDARAVYGGMELGLGVFLAWSALSPGRRAQGLAAAVLTLFGLGLSRALGIHFAQGGVSAQTYQLLGTDLGGAALCTVAAVLRRSAERTPPSR